MDKLEKLAEIEGFEDGAAMIAYYAVDSVVPGICNNPECDYTTEVEPDCRTGYCEVCGTSTVESCLSIAGIA